MPKVWIADDDDAIRMILDEHLKSEGLDVSSFSDGELLLNELDKDVPDLVISDIKMPGVNGYDLLKHLNNNYEDVPVIIMTAFTDMQACISVNACLLYTSPSPRDLSTSRMPSSA